MMDTSNTGSPRDDEHVLADILPEPEVRRPAMFTVWKRANVTFIAFPWEGGFGIADECGNWYGAWQTIENFRARQQSEPVQSLMLSGNAALSIRVGIVR